MHPLVMNYIIGLCIIIYEPIYICKQTSVWYLFEDRLNCAALITLSTCSIKHETAVTMHFWSVHGLANPEVFCSWRITVIATCWHKLSLKVADEHATKMQPIVDLL